MNTWNETSLWARQIRAGEDELTQQRIIFNLIRVQQAVVDSELHELGQQV